MTNNSITQRLKGLVNNLEQILGFPRQQIALKNREYGTIRYSFCLYNGSHFAYDLNLIFKTEGEVVNELLPLEDQTVSFVYKKENNISNSCEKEVATASLDLESARAFFKKINAAIKNEEEKNIPSIVLALINELNEKDEVGEENEEVTKILTLQSNEVENAKNEYYQSTKLLNDARLIAQTEYTDSDERKLVLELESQLNKARQAMFKKQEEINKKYDLVALIESREEKQSNWKKAKENFSDKVLKLCREFKLPLTFAKKFQSVKDIDQEQIKPVPNRLTRFF